MAKRVKGETKNHETLPERSNLLRHFPFSPFLNNSLFAKPCQLLFRKSGEMRINALVVVADGD